MTYTCFKAFSNETFADSYMTLDEEKSIPGYSRYLIFNGFSKTISVMSSGSFETTYVVEFKNAKTRKLSRWP